MYIEDRSSGGMAPLIFKLLPRQMLVVRLSALDALLLDKKLWFPLTCMLGGCWSWCGCFGEEIVLLFLPRFELQIFQCIQWTLDLSFFKGTEKTNDECGQTINPKNYYTL
jgi:hypothetical protein